MAPVRASRPILFLLAAIMFLALSPAPATAGPDRQQATQMVLDLFVHGTPAESTTVAFLYHRDLPDSLVPPGTVLTDHEGTMERIVDTPSFFFFLDHETQYMWGHAARFVTVDALSGEVTASTVSTWPLLNGLVEPRFLPMGNLSPDIVYGQYPERAVSTDYLPVATGTTGSWAVIIVGHPEQDGDADLFKKEAERAKSMLNGMSTGPRVDAAHITTIGIDPQGNAIGATPMEVCNTLMNLAANCDKLHVTYIGHGLAHAGAILRDDDLSWRKLAEKLIATGARDICVTLIACFSGAAIPAFEKAEVKVNGKPRKFKGSIVTSSGRRRPTHVTDESPFAKALEACYQDPFADLNEDKKVTPIEAATWAKFMNQDVADDKGEGKIIGDGSRTVVKTPTLTRTKSQADDGGQLEFEKVKFEFETISDAGDTVRDCRQQLYIKNKREKDHKGKYAVTVWCVDKDAKPATRDSVASFVPAATVGQRVCVARLPAKCKTIEITRGKKAKPASSLSPLSGPVEDVSDATNTIDLAFAYARNEAIFFDLPVLGTPGESYVTALDPVPGWNSVIEPPFFTVPALLDTQIVLVRGVVPDTATVGAWIYAKVMRTMPPDTTIYRIHALLYDSLAVPITGGQEFRHRHLDVPLGMTIAGGLTRIEDSAIHPTGLTSCSVEPGGDLRMSRSVIQPDSGAVYDFAVRGHLEAEYSAWINPAGGLRLESASGSLFDCAVIGSEGSGITVTGNQALMTLDFLTIDGSADHGLVIDNATDVLLTNVGIDSSGSEDVLLRNGSNAELRDCTYDRTRESVIMGSTLRRSWTTAFVVTTFEGDAIAGADVEVVDALGQTVLHQLTDLEGFTDLVPLTEYVRAGNTTTVDTPHTIHVNVAGESRSFLYNADATRIMTLVATDSTSSGTGGGKPPTRFRLAQNRPNPFRDQTSISFDLPEPADVHLRLFDLRGALVAVMADGPYPAGAHRLPWRPEGLASGVYFYILEAGTFREARKLILE